MRPFEQPCDLILIHTLERDGIDFDLQAGRLCGLDTSENLGEIAQRVIALNFSGSSVSSETLMRLMPCALSSEAYFSSCEPLVVIRGRVPYRLYQQGSRGPCPVPLTEASPGSRDQSV